MAIESNFLITGRAVRSEWRNEEEAFIAESADYARRQMSLLDYLASIAHAGNEVTIRSSFFESRGALIHVGNDFFSIVSNQNPRSVHSFVFQKGNETGSTKSIEIDVQEKSEKAKQLKFVKYDKSFRSLLDDLTTRKQTIEIETQQGTIYSGVINLFSDCVSITNSADAKSLVNEGSVIVPVSGIVSVIYTV